MFNMEHKVIIHTYILVFQLILVAASWSVFLVCFFFFIDFFSDISIFKCDSSTFTLRYAVQTLTENPCSGCRINETKVPICQRRLYAPIASCKEESTRISFNLKVWPTDEIPGWWKLKQYQYGWRMEIPHSFICLPLNNREN